MIYVSSEGSNWTERVFTRETSAVFHVMLSSLSEFANDVYFTSTEKKNLLDALFATENKNKYFFCGMEGRKCQNWTNPKLCSNPVINSRNLLGLHISVIAFSVFVFPEKHHKCKL